MVASSLIIIPEEDGRKVKSTKKSKKVLSLQNNGKWNEEKGALRFGCMQDADEEDMVNAQNEATLLCVQSHFMIALKLAFFAILDPFHSVDKSRGKKKLILW